MSTVFLSQTLLILIHLFSTLSTILKLPLFSSYFALLPFYFPSTPWCWYQWAKEFIQLHYIFGSSPSTHTRNFFRAFPEVCLQQVSLTEVQTPDKGYLPLSIASLKS